MLCVEFSQVQYIDLGGIVHGLKALTIVTLETLRYPDIGVRVRVVYPYT